MQCSRLAPALVRRVRRKLTLAFWMDRLAQGSQCYPCGVSTSFGEAKIGGYSPDQTPRRPPFAGTALADRAHGSTSSGPRRAIVRVTGSEFRASLSWCSMGLRVRRRRTTSVNPFAGGAVEQRQTSALLQVLGREGTWCDVAFTLPSEIRAWRFALGSSFPSLDGRWTV